MKKTFFYMIVAMLALSTTSTRAQSLWDTSRADEDFTIGLRLGINFASTDANYANSTLTGVHVGVSADYNIIKSFSLSSGLYYVGRGFRGNHANTKATASKGTTSFLQLPLLASWRIEAPSGVRFMIDLGPYFALGLGGSVEYHPFDQTFLRNYDLDAFGDKGFFKRFDAGLHIGGSVALGHFVAGISYEHGLTDMIKINDLEAFHNRNAMMTIGYNF